jgi:hypothetical protein
VDNPEDVRLAENIRYRIISWLVCRLRVSILMPLSVHIKYKIKYKYEGDKIWRKKN